MLDEKMECFIDVAKHVTVVWLCARLGVASFQPLHYPAYATQTQETAWKGIWLARKKTSDTTDMEMH